MHCPYCGKDQIRVTDSRESEGGRAIRRRRFCESCKKKFTTYERVEENHRLIVVKKSGQRVAFDRRKILAGLEKAFHKRPVDAAEKQRIADEVEEEIFATYDKEVPSSAIGELLIGHLRRVDQVAYVRFASVYQQFKTLEELVAEAKAVLDARRYDVPGQGRLFTDPARDESRAKQRRGEKRAEQGNGAHKAE